MSEATKEADKAAVEKPAPQVPAVAQQPAIQQAPAVQEHPKAPAPSLGRMGPRGIEFVAPEDMFRMARAIFQSGLAPKGFETEQAVFCAIQLGQELGLPPMASVQNIAVINSRPSLWGDSMLGLCQQSGIFDDASFEEFWGNDEEGQFCVCRVRRLPHGKVIERRFSAKDVAVAGLGKKGGPHQDYPKRMLQMRARSWALRDAFPDVLKGLLTTEEMRETVDVVVQAPAGKVAPGKALEQLTEKLAAKELPPPAEEKTIEKPAGVVASPQEPVKAPGGPADQPGAPAGPSKPTWREQLRGLLATADTKKHCQDAYRLVESLLDSEESKSEASNLCDERIEAIAAGRGGRANKQQKSLV